MSLGLKLRQIRKEKKLSQIEVAEKANVAVNSIRLYEANKRQPRMDQLQKIASALEIDVAELLETKPQMDWFRDLGYQIGFDADSKLYYISRNDEKYYSITREEVESIRQLTRNTIETLCFDEKHQVSPEKVNGRLRDKNA